MNNKKVVAVVGLPDYLNLDYKGVDIFARCDYDIIPEALRNLGYDTPIWYTSLNDEFLDINSMLTFHQMPVLMRADSSLANINTRVWVVDGCLCYCSEPTLESRPIPYKYLYHCVWGDTNGNCNGYYFLPDGESFIGPPDEYDKIDPGVNCGNQGEHVYDRNVYYLLILPAVSSV